MGPTGSGKSAFIEALSPAQDLRISKNTLESVTQHVNCYRVDNLRHKYGYTFILMDTPGFLDSKISESHITMMVKEKLDDLRKSAGRVFVFVLYFHPITDIRMSGSKRNAIKLLRAFAESFEARTVNVVTSMWNFPSTPKQLTEANQRFSDLKAEMFLRSETLGIDVTKFEFSQASALSVIDQSWTGWVHDGEVPHCVDANYLSLSSKNLLERITNAQQQLINVAQAKKTASETQLEGRDRSLLDILHADEKATSAALQSFLEDLIKIGPSGLIDLQWFLDVRYEADPSACSSPWSQAVISETNPVTLPEIQYPNSKPQKSHPHTVSNISSSTPPTAHTISSHFDYTNTSTPCPHHQSPSVLPDSPTASQKPFSFSFDGLVSILTKVFVRR
ncbi:hypothetical protein BJ165DRAFT_556348 [Panaeolus papilionaceus]|nr:hypothetical protein BJ165DRAFT_556348 [Panaeolus papilionaceus]